jgi:hypothetical protein
MEYGRYDDDAHYEEHYEQPARGQLSKFDVGR